MILIEQDLQYLSLEQAKALKNPSERMFAVRCIVAGCLLAYQIPIGQSIIDFLVINPKRYGSDKVKPRGKLVEVTQYNPNPTVQKNQSRKNKGVWGSKRRIRQQETQARKNRQIKAMEASGYPWTILYFEQLENIKRAAKAKRRQKRIP